MTTPDAFDVVVVGSGPAGQKAAIQAAKAGRRVAVIEREPEVGGECVRHGTIPSKALRESAVQYLRLRRSSSAFQVSLGSEVPLAALLDRVQDIIGVHNTYMGAQLRRNGIEVIHGRAALAGERQVEVTGVRGERRVITGTVIILATGSRPRQPPEISIDHENVLDSDSILSMTYLPRSLTVLGAGVIACEYASIFAALGVEVNLVDRGERPLPFMDAEIVSRFVDGFESTGSRYLPASKVVGVAWDGVAQVVTSLESGIELRSEKMLVALGRVAHLDGLRIEAVGLKANDRGVVEVDEHLRTSVPHIYAVGDMIGFPALASTSMEQGRRAACHALGLTEPHGSGTLPMGIYTIPEMASVGLDEAQVVEKHGSAAVGRARFNEVARGHISGCPEGLLKMVADPEGVRILGVQIVGDGATEIIHVAQMALVHGESVEAFSDHVFNFPTLAEAYRMAALDLLNRVANDLPAAAADRPGPHAEGDPALRC